MPTTEAKVLKVGLKDGKNACLLQLNRLLPKQGMTVKLKWGSNRTLSQNSFYWVYLAWLINEAGLKDNHGYYSPQALHDNLKAYFLSEKIYDRKKFKQIESESTTTLLTKSEFGEYVEKVREFMTDFFEIDSSPFFENYQENYT